MISGESEASPGWVVSGNMMVNAKKYHAMAVMLEHRYSTWNSYVLESYGWWEIFCGY